MKLLERFFDLVSYDTQSSETSDCTPSTPGQMVLAEHLRDVVKEMGLEDITLDENGYLMATLPANTDKECPTVGFIAHMDTSPDMSGKDVKPRVVKYEGGDIVLNEEQNIVLSPNDFPEMLDYVGEELVVTDGTTLLGADDKAGIAEILDAVAWLQAHPEVKHGKVRIAFNPDEEIGKGAHKFDVERFGCDFAYTMDGGEVGELEYENFNAAGAKLVFKGRNVHPGSAKNKMINAILVGMAFAKMLPAEETPAHTEGYEGFFHLVGIEGSVEEATLVYIIRDHDRKRFEERKELMKECVDKVNKIYPGCCTLEMNDQYYNMREKIEPVMHIIEIAEKAMREAGVTPKVQPIRGGTDGAQLSFKGLPCPNIFAGGLNFHGRYEFVPVESMKKAAAVVRNICKLVAE